MCTEDSPGVRALIDRYVDSEHIETLKKQIEGNHRRDYRIVACESIESTEYFTFHVHRTQGGKKTIHQAWCIVLRFQPNSYMMVHDSCHHCRHSTMSILHSKHSTTIDIPFVGTVDKAHMTVRAACHVPVISRLSYLRHILSEASKAMNQQGYQVSITGELSKFNGDKD